MSGSEAEARPAVSVVVPTFDRRDRLERVLRSLAVQDTTATYEVVVVSDGSTDGTDEYLASGDLPLPIVAVTQPNEGPASARNHGVRRAAGDLVLFVDDDVVADPGLVEAHRRAHDRLGDAVVVVGPMLDPPDHVMRPWVAWEQEMLAKQYDAMERGVYEATARQFYTGNASLRREHFVASGGFDTSFRRAEDVELAYRLADRGMTFHFEPAAVGLHYADRSFESWEATAYAYGRNDVVFARDLGRDWIFPFLRRSFRERHPIVRTATSASIRCRPLGTTMTSLLRPVARSSSSAIPDLVRRFALSTVYSIEFHRGAADELGSGDALRRLLRGG